MKKIILLQLFFIAMFSSVNSFGQDSFTSSSFSASNSDKQLQRIQNPGNTVNALFDLEFDYVLSRGGFSGITWTHSDFWISKWNSDSLFTVNPATGAITSGFFIPGVTGVRGMTFDGTGVWVSNNTTSIYKIDTSSKTVIDTIIAPIIARGISYDSSANVGAGGLWISNYATDIVLIDFTGATQNSILAGTHGLSGMYSIAFDPWSTGGPYIWAFDFGPAGTVQNLVRIKVSNGVKDVIHDVGIEIGGSGIAGGLSITGFAHPGPHTIIGISQDSPDRIFGLELGDYTPPVFDASADTINFFPPNTATPAFLLTPIGWDIVTTNNGTSTLDTIFGKIIVNDGSTNVHTDSAFTLATPSLAKTNVYFPATYTPPAASGISYNVTSYLTTGIQTDQINTNDTLNYSFSVTDTTMRRNGSFSGSIGLTSGSAGSIGLKFEVPIASYATSITLTLRRPPLGEVITAELFGWAGSAPGALLTSSANYTIQPADTGGAVITLPLLNAPLLLSPGSYTAAIHQSNNNVSISYSLFNWRPNTCWIVFGAGAWGPSENNNFRIVPFIALNLWSQNMVSVTELNSDLFTVYPNPGTSNITLDFSSFEKYNITITDVQGRVVYFDVASNKNKVSINTSDWENGVYMATVESAGKKYYSKIIVSH